MSHQQEQQQLLPKIIIGENYDESSSSKRDEDLKTPTKPLEATGNEASLSSMQIMKGQEESSPSKNPQKNTLDSNNDLSTSINNNNNNNTLGGAELCGSSTFFGSLSVAPSSPQAKTKKNTTASPEMVQAVEDHTLRSNTRAASASPAVRDGAASPMVKSFLTLHYATDAEMAEYMISKGADIEALDKGGLFFVGVVPPASSSSNENFDVVNSRSASPTGRRRTGSPSASSRLISSRSESYNNNGAPIGNEDEKFVYQRPLHAAAQAGRWDVACVLLLNGAQVNAMTGGDIEVTPLDYAIENLHFDVFDLLKAQGGQRTVASFSRMLARGLDEAALKKLEKAYRRKKALEEGKEVSDDDDEEEFKLLDDVHAASPPTKSLRDDDDIAKRAASAPPTKGKDKNKFVIDFSKEFRPDLDGARRSVLKNRRSQQREKSADDARATTSVHHHHQQLNKAEKSTSKKNSPENHDHQSHKSKSLDAVTADSPVSSNNKNQEKQQEKEEKKNKNVKVEDDDDARDARLVNIIEDQLREQQQQDAMEASVQNNNIITKVEDTIVDHQEQTSKTEEIKPTEEKKTDVQQQNQISDSANNENEGLSSPQPQDPNQAKKKINNNNNNNNNNKNNNHPKSDQNNRKTTPQRRPTTTTDQNPFIDGFYDAAHGKKGGPRILPPHHETFQVVKRKQLQEEKKKKEEHQHEGEKQPNAKSVHHQEVSTSNRKSRFDSPTASSALKRTNSNTSSVMTANSPSLHHNKNNNARTNTPPPVAAAGASMRGRQHVNTRTSSANSNKNSGSSSIPQFTAWPDSIKVSRGTSSWARSTTPRMPIQIEIARGLYLPMNQVPDRAGGRRSLTEHELERERQEQIKRHKEILEEHEKERKSGEDNNNDHHQHRHYYPSSGKRKMENNTEDHKKSTFVPLTPSLRRDADIVEYILDKPNSPDEVAKQRALNDRLATPRRPKKQYTIDDDENGKNNNTDSEYEDHQHSLTNPPWNGRQQLDDSPVSIITSRGRRLSPKEKREIYESEKAVYMENAKIAKEEREKARMERVQRIKNFEQEMRIKRQNQHQHDEQKKQQDDADHHQENEVEKQQQENDDQEVRRPPWNARAKPDPSPSLFSSDHIRQIREHQHQTRASSQPKTSLRSKPASLFLPSASNSEQPQREEITMKNEEENAPLRQQQQQNTLRGRDVAVISSSSTTKRDTPTRIVNARNSTPTRRPLTTTTATSVKNSSNTNTPTRRMNTENKNLDDSKVINTSSEQQLQQQNSSPLHHHNQNHHHTRVLHVSPSGRVSDPSISTTLAMYPNAAPRSMDQISFLAFGNAPFSATPVQQRNYNNASNNSPSKRRTATPTRGGGGNGAVSIKDEEVLGKPRWQS